MAIAVRLGDPDVAARVANEYSDGAVALQPQVYQGDMATVRDFLEAQVNQSRERMDKAGEDLLAYRTSAHVELRRRGTETLVSQRGELLTVLVGLEATSAGLRRAEEELAKQQPMLSLRKTIGSDPVAMEAARNQGVRSDELLRMQLQEDVLNPVYGEWQAQVASSRTHLAELEGQRAELAKNLRLDGTELRKFAELYQREIQLSKLEAEYDVARRVFSDLATRCEQARVQMASRNATAQVVDRALPFETAVSPNLGRNIASGFAIGVLLAALLAIALEIRRKTIGL